MATVMRLPTRWAPVTRSPAASDGPDAGSANGVGEEPVTLTVERRVARGREREFEDWARGALAAASRREGFLGGGLLRPGPTHREWHRGLSVR